MPGQVRQSEDLPRCGSPPLVTLRKLARSSPLAAARMLRDERSVSNAPSDEVAHAASNCWPRLRIAARYRLRQQVEAGRTSRGSEERRSGRDRQPRQSNRSGASSAGRGGRPEAARRGEPTEGRGAESAAASRDGPSGPGPRVEQAATRQRRQTPSHEHLVDEQLQVLDERRRGHARLPRRPRRPRRRQRRPRSNLPQLRPGSPSRSPASSWLPTTTAMRRPVPTRVGRRHRRNSGPVRVRFLAEARVVLLSAPC